LGYEHNFGFTDNIVCTVGALITREKKLRVVYIGDIFSDEACDSDP